MGGGWRLFFFGVSYIVVKICDGAGAPEPAGLTRARTAVESCVSFNLCNDSITPGLFFSSHFATGSPLGFSSFPFSGRRRRGRPPENLSQFHNFTQPVSCIAGAPTPHLLPGGLLFMQLDAHGFPNVQPLRCSPVATRNFSGMQTIIVWRWAWRSPVSAGLNDHCVWFARNCSLGRHKVVP